MTTGDHTITATMENHAAARDFLSRLPLEITLLDSNDITEKIFYPSPVLTIAGITRGCQYRRGISPFMRPGAMWLSFARAGRRAAT